MCVQEFTSLNGASIPETEKQNQPQVGDIDYVIAIISANDPRNRVKVDLYVLERFGTDYGYGCKRFIDVTDIDEAVIGTITDALKSGQYY